MVDTKEDVFAMYGLMAPSGEETVEPEARQPMPPVQPESEAPVMPPQGSDDVFERYGLTPPEAGVLDPATAGIDADTPIVNTRQDKLRKRDLESAENLAVIRRYMTDRYGEQMVSRYDTDRKLVERFVDSMRFYNGNIAGTVGEATWISRASDSEKEAAGRAYELFDRLGNVFVNDGVTGAMDGIKDYVFAVARDPSTYAGLLTGGAAKAGGLASQAAMKGVINEAAKKAAKEALRKGMSREAKERYVQEKVEDAISRAGVSELTKRNRDRLVKRAEELAVRGFKERRRAQAEDAYLKEVTRKPYMRAMFAAFGIDAGTAWLQSDIDQNNMIEVGAQEQYSMIQQGVATALGGFAAPAISLAGNALAKATGRTSGRVEMREGRELAKLDASIEYALKPKEVEKAKDMLGDLTEKYREAVARGMKAGDGLERAKLPANFFQEFLYGENGDGGLVGILASRGKRLPSNYKVSELVVDLTNNLRDVDPDFYEEINDTLLNTLGFRLTDMEDQPFALGDLFAANISQGASYMSALSRINKTVDSSINVAATKMKEQAEALDEELAELGSNNVLRYAYYAHNLWRRLLTSAVDTTAVNLLGFGNYYGIGSLADMLNASVFFTTGLMRKGLLRDDEGGNKLIAQGQAYLNVQKHKMQNLFDPHVARDRAEVILEQHTDAKRILIDSQINGHELTKKKFGFGDDNQVITQLESWGNAAAVISGVRAQDGTTKSLYFTDTLDKELMLTKGISLTEVLESGKGDLIDSDMVLRAVNKTLGSVYAQDKTIEANNSNGILRGLAYAAEAISRQPIIGTFLPFGRFMNNAIANIYEDGLGGYLGAAGYMMRGAKERTPLERMEMNDALARSVVFTTLVGSAVTYALNAEDEGLGAYQMRVGDNLYNVQNVFPASLILTLGRFGAEIVKKYAPDKGNGKPFDPARFESALYDIGEQLTFGQFARDFQLFDGLQDFITGLSDAVNGTTREEVSLIDIEGFARVFGGTGSTYVSGATRPLDIMNTWAATLTDSPYRRDVRGANGSVDQAVQASTKYVDNIAEYLMEKVDDITGSNLQDSRLYKSIAGVPLRVAVREGDVQPNENIIGDMFGVKQISKRTFVESLLDSVDVEYFRINERKRNPQNDRTVNSMLGQMLEPALRKLVMSDSFRISEAPQRREQIKNVIGQVRTEINKFLDSGFGDQADYLERYRERMMRTPRVARSFAINKMREMYNFKGTMRDMTLSELVLFEQMVDLHKTLSTERDF